MAKDASGRTLGAASIGNFGEIYYFAVFGFSVPVIAAHFFPTGNSTAALLSTFAVYAVAFFARPIGGLVFGYLLDRVGRVKVLSMTIWLMAAGTALIGLVPTYDSIGIAAPFLLVLCRLAQGFAMGGELTGSTAFILESAPSGRRGRWVGIIYFFANLPNALVALMLLGAQLLAGKDAYMEWAWRIPFLLGGLIGVVGYWLRRNLEDPEEFRQAFRKAPERNPLRAVTGSGLKAMMHVAMLLPVISVASYLILGFMYTYLVKQVGMDSRLALFSNAAGIASFAVFLPVGGALSDRFGRKRVLTVGALWVGAVAYFCLWLASSGSFLDAAAGQMILAAATGLYGGACFVTAAELFPTSFRATGHAIAYQTTVAVLGGTTPLVCAWLVSSLGSPLAPAWYVSIVALVNVVLIRCVPETRDVALSTSLGTTPSQPPERSGVAKGAQPETAR